MNKNNFGDDTWKNVDSSKITSYVNSMSFASDRMIEILKMNNIKKSVMLVVVVVRIRRSY